MGRQSERLEQSIWGTSFEGNEKLYLYSIGNIKTGKQGTNGCNRATGNKKTKRSSLSGILAVFLLLCLMFQGKHFKIWLMLVTWLDLLHC